MSSQNTANTQKFLQWFTGNMPSETTYVVDFSANHTLNPKGTYAALSQETKTLTETLTETFSSHSSQEVKNLSSSPEVPLSPETTSSPDTPSLKVNKLLYDKVIYFHNYPLDDSITNPFTNNSGEHITLEGEFSTPGDEIIVDNNTELLLESYSSAPYLTGYSPHCLMFAESDDYTEFLNDADTAFNNGIFNLSIARPNVFIADLGLLLSISSQQSLPKLLIEQDGTIRQTYTSKEIEIGLNSKNFDPSSNKFNQYSLLDKIVPKETVRQDLQSRLWLSRYANATKFLSILGEDSSRIRVDGFGENILSPQTPLSDPALPFIGQIEEQFIAWSPLQNKLYKISADVAIVLKYLTLDLSNITCEDPKKVLSVSETEFSKALDYVKKLFALGNLF